jgi:hypothetical protein
MERDQALAFDVAKAILSQQPTAGWPELSDVWYALSLEIIMID